MLSPHALPPLNKIFHQSFPFPKRHSGSASVQRETFMAGGPYTWGEGQFGGRTPPIQKTCVRAW